ncbi:maleylpyruvate isomerase family mycothiol-dependent enzyme [Pseudonocardia nematodicida]|uniref:Maleylpyruvate isomerase family mycothiol-dependent enzyme n=1 Tax=Pseudonocardia nematodicida TaxID=1206997 RepID=A0ABV1KBF4_9PSEU
MDDQAVFAAIARVRLRFADLIDSIDDDRLGTPSLCAGWAVRDVAGHLSIASAPSLPALLWAVLRAGGSYDRAMDRLSRDAGTRPVAELAATIRANAGSRFAMPEVGPRGPLTDVLVHTVDVAQPLGLEYDAGPDGLRAALEFVTAGRATAFVARGRLAGLRLVADDVGFAAGAGAEVTGRAIDILAAACGRAAVLDRLTGPGVEILRAR